MTSDNGDGGRDIYGPPPTPEQLTEEISATVSADEFAPMPPPGVLPDGTPQTPPVRAFLHPLQAINDLSRALGPVGLFPLGVLLGLAAVERLDAVAFGVLSPEIRDAFHLSNAGFDSIVGLTAALPIFMAFAIGYIGDRYNRVRITQIAGFIWGLTAILTGLAPVIGILIVARLLGGVGLLVNEPIHPSLLADYYPPQEQARVQGIHRLGAVVGLIGGPLAGLLVGTLGWSWRGAFIVLAIPTFVLVALVGRMREPRRGGTVGAAADEGEDTVGIGEAFRRLKAIRSLKRTWVAAFLFGAGSLAFASFLNTFLKDVYNASPNTRGGITLLFGLFSAAGLITGAGLATRMQMQRGPQALPIVNGLMVIEFGVGIILMALAPWLGLSALFAGLLGIGASGFLPPYLAMVALVAPPKLRAQAYAWSLMFYGFGAFIVSRVIGSIVDNQGQRTAMVVLGVLTIGGGLIELTARGFVKRDVEQAVNAETISASAALLHCSKVDVAYDQVQVLFGVDLEVYEGEIVALLGTNGAGKSTLLRAISGLSDPIGGAIFFGGRDVTHADANATARMGIAQVPGGRGVFPTLTVAENMRVAGWMRRGDQKGLKEATERVLEYFPVLRERWDTMAGSLSGGEQQMLSLGQAFIAQPRLMLIDELSLGLAPTVVEKLLHIVRAIHDNGTTIILVEQSVNLALRLAERAVFMEKGEVRFSGPTAELLERGDILRAVYLKGAAAVAEGEEGVGLEPEGEPQGEVSSNGKAAVAHASDGAAAQGRSTPRLHVDPVVAEKRRAELLTKPAVLETVGLSKRYGGVAAVNDVDLTVHEGEILGLIGPNGAGKTTIFDLICGFTPNNGGRVFLHGEDVSERSANERAARGLGRSFQDARLWQSLTVREAIAVGMERRIQIRSALPALLGLPSVAESERMAMKEADELIGMMGLWSFRNKFVSELSTGSRRIVEIAVILAHRPSVLILDEPSSGIAQKETEALGPLLKEAQSFLNCSMLIIEHDMPLISSLADHLVALERGTVVTHGAPADVLRHPQVVESYLGGAEEPELV